MLDSIGLLAIALGSLSVLRSYSWLRETAARTDSRALFEAGMGSVAFGFAGQLALSRDMRMFATILLLLGLWLAGVCLMATMEVIDSRATRTTND